MVLPPRLHLTRRLPPLNAQQLLSLHPTISPRRDIQIFSPRPCFWTQTEGDYSFFHARRLADSCQRAPAELCTTEIFSGAASFMKVVPDLIWIPPGYLAYSHNINNKHVKKKKKVYNFHQRQISTLERSIWEVFTAASMHFNIARILLKQIVRGCLTASFWHSVFFFFSTPPCVFVGGTLGRPIQSIRFKENKWLSGTRPC